LVLPVDSLSGMAALLLCIEGSGRHFPEGIVRVIIAATMTSKLPASLGKSLFSYQPRQPLPPADEVTALPAPEPQVAEGESPLVERARSDPAAFGQLYERYVDRVYSYIYHRVGNVQEAEDLTARTFYRALDKLDTYEDRGLPFSAWLFRIAHNLTANWHRDRSQRSFLSLDRLLGQGTDKETPEAQITQQEEKEALMEAIDRLPEERRNLLHYKFGTSLSNLEIGEIMNKSESAIKSLYFRTLAALRQDLEDRGWGGAGPSVAEAEPILVRRPSTRSSTS
jgi:RNA polymerase sigma-70 factor, ECF subfamily